MVTSAHPVTRCEYCGKPMPPGRPPHAKRCSFTCTIRAAGGVAPPGARSCPKCGAAIDPAAHANLQYCSVECRPRG